MDILAGFTRILEPVRRRGRKSIEALRLLRRRVGDRHFWITQGLIAAVTALHYFIETTGLVGSELGFHDIPVIVYVIPIIYASLHFGFEGGVFTGIACLLLSLPNMVFWHRDGYEWVGELAMLSVLIVAGDFLGARAEEELQLRRKAERTSTRLALLNQIGESPSHAMEVEQQLPRVLRLLLSGLSLQSIWLRLEPEHPDAEPLLIQEATEPWPVPAEGRAAMPPPMEPGLGTSPDDGAIVVPLARDGSELGLLSARLPAGATLSDEQAELLTTVAHEIQVAVENARLYRERQESLRSYASQVTQAQEEERLRIARELHDETAQDLVRVVRKLEQLGKGCGPDLTGPIDELLSLTRNTLQTVRRYSRDLRPSVLDDLGLVPTLEALVEEASIRLRSAARLRVVGTSRRLPGPVELSLFRIAQEALRNVEKHGDATAALVELAFDGTETRLSVTDDGKGFTPPANISDLARAGKLGLVGMKERAELVGGRFYLRSDPGGGTQVKVVVSSDERPAR